MILEHKKFKYKIDAENERDILRDVYRLLLDQQYTKAQDLLSKFIEKENQMGVKKDMLQHYDKHLTEDKS